MMKRLKEAERRPNPKLRLRIRIGGPQRDAGGAGGDDVAPHAATPVSMDEDHALPHKPQVLPS